MVRRKKIDAVAEVNTRIEKAVAKKRGRSQRPFPACPFEEALAFAQEIYRFGAGQKVRRISLFDHLGKSPESSASRMLIVNAGKYGLIEGGYQAESLTLTEDGARAVDEEAPKREQAKARVALAVQGIEPFGQLYERFKGNKLPAKNALIDAIKEFGVPKDFAEEGVDTFIVNARFVGILQTLSGAERLVSEDHLLDSLPSSRFASPDFSKTSDPSGQGGALIGSVDAKWEMTCFYITPIGEEGTEHRKHSDLFLGSIIEPALEAFGMKVVRADAIDKPGTITKQIIEHLIRSRLVIADLSFHNPNVFYELAIRHAARLPVVQVIRSADRVPFDLNQVRTVRIDTTDIYSLVPKIESFRSEIASQVRRALDDPESVDNPIVTFYPAFRAIFDSVAS